LAAAAVVQAQVEHQTLTMVAVVAVLVDNKILIMQEDLEVERVNLLLFLIMQLIMVEQNLTEALALKVVLVVKLQEITALLQILAVLDLMATAAAAAVVGVTTDSMVQAQAEAALVDKAVQMELLELQILAAAAVAVVGHQMVAQVVQVLHELYFGHKENNYGTTLCISKKQPS
jgi:predicted nucleotidyltransferase